MSVPSPCIRLCELDAHGQFCVGCLRTRAEIAAWAGASDAERQHILHCVAMRRATEEDNQNE